MYDKPASLRVSVCFSAKASRADELVFWPNYASFFGFFVCRQMIARLQRVSSANCAGLCGQKVAVLWLAKRQAKSFSHHDCTENIHVQYSSPSTQLSLDLTVSRLIPSPPFLPPPILRTSFRLFSTSNWTPNPCAHHPRVCPFSVA